MSVFPEVAWVERELADGGDYPAYIGELPYRDHEDYITHGPRI